MPFIIPSKNDSGRALHVGRPGRVSSRHFEPEGLSLRLLGLGGFAARVAALGDAGRLAGAAAQIIELGAADGAAADDLDRIDVRRIEREDALDALAEADLADGEAGADALVRAGDADAFEILDAGALAFDDLDADAQRVAGAEFGDRAYLR